LPLPYSDIPQIFALLIGINKYKNPEIRELFGCVNDCNNVRNYLTSCLGVPEGHIVVLTNEAATRHAILSNFESHLVQNSRIKKGDAILFYYAGHGSRIGGPSGWLTSDDKIEMISSYDERTPDSTGKFIHGIPDLTINALMRILAFYKGDNIVRALSSHLYFSCVYIHHRRPYSMRAMQVAFHETLVGFDFYSLRLHVSLMNLIAISGSGQVY
jgi:Caspase domain